MNNRLTNITTEYRTFSKGQYVEHTQFNEFLDYFEDQDRLSKTLLRGVGIACGLKHQLKYSTTDRRVRVVDGVEISQGIGVTTDGDLITLSDITQVSDELGVSDLKKINLKSKCYSFFKPYDNSKVNYPPFYEDDGNQIPLWELSETNNKAEEYTPVNESSDAILNILYLLIYIESYEKEVRPCRGVDCDNHGLQQIQNVKVLFTNLRGITNIVKKGDTLYPHPSNSTFPELRLKRALANPELNSIGDLKKIYSDIVLDTTLLNDMSAGIATVTSHFKIVNRFDQLDLISKLTNTIALNNDGATGFQYAYDFMKDLVETYNEIKTLLPKSFTSCFPDFNAFPKHVMIGKVVDNTANNFRHEFYNSPILDDEAVEAKIKILIQRFNELVENFGLPTVSKVAPDINITPSRKSIELSSKAIPFYYNIDEEFLKRWSFDKTSHRIADRNLTYNILNPLLSNDANIKGATAFNLEKNTFYRIEGHQSQPYSLVQEVLNFKKNASQLSFDVMSLSLEELNNNKDLSKAYFKEYVAEHPGIEHMAGVEPGGTFVIVYESEANPIVIADFSLPYLCCGPKVDVSLSLPVDEICSGSKAIPFTVSPLDGVVETVNAIRGNGGVVKIGEQYFFDPTLVSSSFYNTDIGFTVNGKSTGTTIRVVSQPNVLITVDNITPSENDTDVFVTYRIEGTNNANYQYEFDFLGNGNYISVTPVNGIVGYTFFNYRNTKSLKTPITNVIVSGNGCSDTIEVIVQSSNEGPTANAGSDASIQLPENSVTLDGSLSDDTDGTIVSYLWTKTSFLDATIETPTNELTEVTGMAEGEHTFELTVTDNSGDTSTDTVTITVLPRKKVGPTANAGNDVSIQLPGNSVTLDGTLSDDTDGTIEIYSWVKKTALRAIIANPNDIMTTVTSMVEGEHVFELTVEDNDGLIAVDTVTITVLPAKNVAPTANAGSDASIQLPENSVTLDGSLSDDIDGSIASYSWVKTSLLDATIETPTNELTEVTGMAEGEHTFELTVTDNSGDTSTDTVIITVLPAKKVGPTAEAGNSRSIRLPQNSTTLDGSSSTDLDGNIENYFWVKRTSLRATIEKPNDATTLVTNMVEGTHIFELTVEDNDGLTDVDTVTISVVNREIIENPKGNCDPNLECCVDDGNGGYRPAVGDEPCI